MKKSYCVPTLLTATIFLTILYGNSARADADGTQADWPNFLGPNYDGISHETEWSADWPEEGPKVLWKINVGAGGGCPSIVGDRIFTMGYVDGQDTVYCLDQKNGKTIWKWSYPCTRYDNQHDGGPSCTPAVADGKVYTLSRDSRLLCFDSKDGSKPLWDKDLRKDLGLTSITFGTTGSPVVDGDAVIVEVGRTVALNKDTGDILWKTDDYQPGYASPLVFTVDGKKYVAVFNRFGPMIFDRTDGQVVWKDQWGGGNHCSTPILVDGDKIFFTAYYQEGSGLVRMNGGKPEYVWRRKNQFMNIFNTPVHRDGYFYGYDGEFLACAEIKTGDIKWKTSEKFGWATLALAHDKLLALNAGNELFVVEATPEGYKEINNAQVLGGMNLTPPVLLRGLLYCRNGKGDLVCLDLRKKG